MKRSVQFVGLLVAIAYYVSCAPARFDKDVNCGSNCVEVNGKKTYRYSIIPNSGKVDILFVDDNSGSMSTEQNAIASRFNSFISALDARSIDYRIAITTTDISVDGGKLIPFGSGISYLTNQTSNKATLFSNTIRRQETINCENYLNSNPGGADSSAYAQHCPSPDERGIFAANTVVRTNPAGFIRPEAHLAVVFIADEDERSQLYDKTSMYRLEPDDLPQTLIERVQSLYSGKSLSAHSIIVRPGSLNGVTAIEAADRLASVINGNGSIDASKVATALFHGGDSSCLAIQSSQTNGVLGSYGYLYALAARLTGGVEGDVCASDYGSQLYSIGENIGEQVAEHTLKCDNPEVIDSVTPMVTFTPTGGSYSLFGSKMTFNPNITPGTQAYLQYACPM